MHHFDKITLLDPPPRPVAPKPDNTMQDPTGVDGSLPTAAVPPHPMPVLNTMPGFEGPKLKDYLPFMKPKTFGKDRDKDRKGASRSDPNTATSVPGNVLSNFPESAPVLPQVLLITRF